MVEGSTEVPFVTFTNIHGQAKTELIQLVNNLGGNYSGSLRVKATDEEIEHSGTTTHLVCGPGYDTSQKFQVALVSGIQIVQPDWLLASADAGYFVDTDEYLLNHHYTTAQSKARTLTPTSPEVLRRAAAPSPTAIYWQDNAAFSFRRPSSSDTGAVKDNVDVAINGNKQQLHFIMTLDNIPELKSPAAPVEDESEQQVNHLTDLMNALTPTDSHHPNHTTPESSISTSSKENINTLHSSINSNSSSKQQSNCKKAATTLCPSPAALSSQPMAKITLGPRLSPPPTNIEAIIAHHGDAVLTDVQKESISFYPAAAVEMPNGSVVEFQAGDAGHGALMLYDIVDGRKVMARAVIRKIYTLGGSEEDVWMGKLLFIIYDGK